jgi:DNA repair exonuclease SbcCD nuclease subunit
MKLAIINYTHFGERNDSPFFLEQSFKFFDEVFFPYLKKNKIKNVLHLGDLLDRRKYINFNTLSQMRKRFLEPLIENKINTYITIGNHDTYYKNTNSLNSLRELFNNESNYIKILETPEVLNFDDTCIGMVPWIAKDNETQCLKFIKDCACPILVGHFEIKGFQVINGVVHQHGITEKEFSRFEMVLSGHFHIKQSKGNIHYVGTQYELNFGDESSQKGFHILDTKTRTLEFIKNPNKIFFKIKYDDTKKETQDLLNEDFSKYKNCFVKIMVMNKTKPYVFDKFVDNLYAASAQEISIIEDYQEKQIETDIDIAEDTLSIINKEIDVMENVDNKDKLKLLVKDLYMESLTL